MQFEKYDYQRYKLLRRRLKKEIDARRIGYALLTAYTVIGTEAPDWVLYDIREMDNDPYILNDLSKMFKKLYEQMTEDQKNHIIDTANADLCDAKYLTIPTHTMHINRIGIDIILEAGVISKEEHDLILNHRNEIQGTRKLEVAGYTAVKKDKSWEATSIKRRKRYAEEDKIALMNSKSAKPSSSKPAVKSTGKQAKNRVKKTDESYAKAEKIAAGQHITISDRNNKDIADLNK